MAEHACIRALIALTTLATVSCSPKIKCNSRGLIEIPNSVSTDVFIDWSARNRELVEKRTQAALGSNPYASPEDLAKAEGCP